MSMTNVFETAKQSLVLKPKTVAKQAFNYKSVSDLKNLIAFVGSKPKVDISESGELIPTYRKKTIVPGCIVLRDSFGNVTDVMTYALAAEVYEIAAQRDFDLVKDQNKVEEKAKEKKEKKEKK